MFKKFLVLITMFSLTVSLAGCVKSAGTVGGSQAPKQTATQEERDKVLKIDIKTPQGKTEVKNQMGQKVGDLNNSLNSLDSALSSLDQPLDQ